MPSVCVIGHPAPGHVNPTLPVVAELCARGERVTYFASEPFRPAIERTGARFRACGAHELFERNLGSGGMLGGMAGLIRTAEEILPGLIDSVREEAPDYLLVEAHAVWGNLLAQILRLPAVTLCSMFAMNERLLRAAELMHHLYSRAPREAALEGLAALGEYFEFARRLVRRYGVECPGIIQYLGNPQRLNIVFTSREFQPGGSLFDSSYVFVGPQPEGRAEPEFPFEELGSEPLILVSMGTMYNDEPAFYRACFDAFGKSRYRVVLAAGHRINAAALGSAPGNFIVRQYVPQVSLLKRASLFITHGGINSAHEAMLHGVPMVVLPQRADHHVVAGQVEKAGAGVVLDRSAVSAARLAELVEVVLAEPGYRRNSASVGETLQRAGGAARAANVIQSFIREAIAGERTLCR